MQITCPQCGVELAIQDHKTGTQVTCPKCRGQFVAPPIITRSKSIEESTHATPPFKDPHRQASLGQQIKNLKSIAESTRGAVAHDDEFAISRRSSWSTAISILGHFFIGGAMLMACYLKPAFPI